MRAQVNVRLMEAWRTSEIMTDSLTARILAFELDAPGARFPFTSRLAREQGWSHAHAGRVVMEYKRFLVLAMTAGHPVTPSVQVDQVWHLHMIYTESYWHGLCRDVLGRELHHGPTMGGEEEGAKFTDWYERTLASYRRIFDNEPPPDIWPPPRERFANHGIERHVDTADFWLIRKPSWLKRLLRK